MFSLKRLIFIISSILVVVYFLSQQNQVANKKNEIVNRFEVKIKQAKEQRRINIEYIVIPDLVKKQKTHESLSLDESEDLKVQQIVATFKKNHDNIVRSWNDYRVEMYRFILSEEELHILDNILESHMVVISEIQSEISQYKQSTEEYKVLYTLDYQSYKAMDEDVRSYLGDERFQYVLKARSEFNKAFQKHSQSYSEIIGW